MCLHEVPHDAQPLGPVQRPEGVAVPILPLAPETLDQAASTELIAPYLADGIRGSINSIKRKGKSII